jgi:hypothetical protein
VGMPWRMDPARGRLRAAVRGGKQPLRLGRTENSARRASGIPGGAEELRSMRALRLLGPSFGPVLRRRRHRRGTSEA